jgi:prolyl-tRNA editing enzyme YbaK/EbsC (Cys-tRNA(Pro) deacylase)
MSILLPLVEQALKALGIAYRALDCDPELADTAAFCEHYGFAPEQSANTIVVAGKTDPRQYVCCVVLATTRLDVNKAVRQLMGVKKASFAPMDEALQVTGMEYGGVTAFGMPPEVPVYVDARVMERGEVVMGGGNRSSKLLLDPLELKKIPGVQIIEGLAK